MPSPQDWQRAESYYRSGNYDAAGAVCESLLGTALEHAGVHWMLSRVHQARTRFRLAVRHARRSAAGISKLVPQQQVTLTRGLISVGDYQAAVQALRGLELAKPMDAQTLTEIVDQFTTLDEHASALAWLERAQQQGHRSSQISFLRGNNLKFVGDLAGAAGAYEDAIVRTPGNPHAHLARATLSTVEGAGARIDRIRSQLSRSPPAESDPKRAATAAAVLYYALFRELDTLGDHDGAWDALARAMRHKRMTIRHDRGHEDALFDRLIATYSADYLSGGAGQDQARTPVFIVGMPRSGTTLVERVLGNHSAVATCGELSDLRMAFKWASDYYCNAFLDGEAAARIAGVDAHALGKDYLERTAWRVPARAWFSDKHPGNYLLCGLILRAIPHARIINVRRNPMDSCFANLRELFAQHYYEYSYGIADVANHYRNYTRLMQHVSEQAPGRVLDVQYEDFVRHPAGETSRILGFCGLPPEAGLTDLSGNSAPVSTASSVQVRAPIHADRIAYWRRYQSHLAPLVEVLEATAEKGAP